MDIRVEFVAWKPFEVVFVPEEEVFGFADLYISAKVADEELAWVMAKVIDDGQNKEFPPNN